jgi:hypothetical protein
MVADDDDSLSPELHTVVRPEFSRPALQVLVYARCVDLEEIAEDWDASGVREVLDPSHPPAGPQLISKARCSGLDDDLLDVSLKSMEPISAFRLPLT